MAKRAEPAENDYEEDSEEAFKKADRALQKYLKSLEKSDADKPVTARQFAQGMSLLYKAQSATMLLVLDEMASMLQDFLESLHEEPDEEE